jgi:group II intron reverse transcriptase/maturase
VYIDKPGKPGQKRPLGIPPLADRVVQELLRSVLEPIFESRFHPHSYGFRPFRSTHHAIQRVRSLIKQGYTWVIEGDIKGFFDHVDHDILMQLVRRDVGDPRVLSLIRAFLKAGVLEDGTFTVSDEGTPQGGILSPLLANIYLNELDWYVASMYENLPKHSRKKQPFGCFISRFADDFVILVRGTEEQAKGLKADLAQFLQETLRLELSPEKTLVTHVDTGFDFLGFHIRRYEQNGRKVVLATPSKKAQAKFTERIRELTHSVIYSTDHLWIMDLNEYLSGWAEYFRRGNSKRIFSKLDNILWWLIARRMRKRWQSSKAKGGFAQFLREQLIPYRFDVQHPQYRRHRGRNFGLWVDSGKKLALIVDQLTFYPIHYPPLYTQVHPYTPEGRARVEALRRAGRLVNRAWRIGPPEKMNGPKVYALVSNWLAQQDSRCATCGKALDKRDVQQLLVPLVGRLQNTSRGTVTVLCKTCLKANSKGAL